MAMANCENCIKSDVCKYYEPKSTVAFERYSAPVRHGHWIRVKGIIQCNICGFGLFPDGYFFENGECTHSNEQDYRLNFCPNCGAKMDKES